MTTPPPARRRPPRPSRAATVLTVLVLLVGAVVLAVADVPARSVGANGDVSPWVPSDGASGTGELNVTGELSGTNTGTASSALFAAPQATQSLPTTMGAVLIGALEHDLAVTVWRRTIATADRDRYEVYTAGPDLRLLAVTRARITGYTGGILVLPRHATPGDRWQSSGTTIHPDGQQWQARFTAAAGEGPDCIVTEGVLTVAGSGEGSGEHRISQTWCHGRGLVQDRWVAPDGGVTEWTETGDSTAAVDAIETVDATAAPDDPRDRTVTEFHPVTTLPGADPEPMSGTPSGPPLATSSGLVVLRSGGDIVVLDPGEDATLVARHRLHPGGAITAVGVFGEVVLAATTTRELVAWAAPTGAVLWRSAIDDVAHPRLERLTDDTVLVALASGEVLALELRTGAELWRAAALVGKDFPAAIAPPGAGTVSGSVLLAGSSGTVELRDAASGAVRWVWRTDGMIDGVALGPERAWVMTDLGLYGIDPASGESLVLRRAGTATLPFVVGDRVVLVRPEGVRALDVEGREAWRQPYECLSGLAGPGGLLCWQADRVRLLDPDDGRVVAEHDVPAHGNGQLSTSVSGSAVWWRVTTADGSSWVVFRWSA